MAYIKKKKEGVNKKRLRKGLVAQMDKESSCSAGDLGSVPEWEGPLEEGMTIHSSILAWRIPWTEEDYCPWGQKELETTEQLADTG